VLLLSINCQATATREALDIDGSHRVSRLGHPASKTGLTNAAVAGTTIAELMALAGNSTPGAAIRYQHAASNRMQELAVRLSQLAAPARSV
jgi:hypothetical protein